MIRFIHFFGSVCDSGWPFSINTLTTKLSSSIHSKLKANSHSQQQRALHSADMDVLSKMTRAISDALQDPEKLPAALILCGVLEAAAVLSLVFFRVPRAAFVHHGEKAFSYVYYAALIAIVVFGLAEAAVGFWVSGLRRPCWPASRRKGRHGVFYPATDNRCRSRRFFFCRPEVAAAYI